MDSTHSEDTAGPVDPPGATPDGEGGDLRSQARRYLDDLVAFEGRRFILPEGVEFGVVPAAAATETAALDRLGQLEAFRQSICECTACSLGEGRQRFVFGTGNPEAGIVFVGEAPGAEEDRQGEPFVGAAGQLLTKIIEAMKLRREDVYICNVLKCRPPNNRDPRSDEVTTCEPHLQRQLDIIQPRVICALGRHAAHCLLKRGGTMRELRGQLHDYRGIPVIVTYHPAALLRDNQYKRATWEDMKWLRREYDGLEL